MKILIVNFDNYSGKGGVYIYNGSWNIEEITKDPWEIAEVDCVEKSIVKFADQENCSSYVVFANGVLQYHGTL